MIVTLIGSVYRTGQSKTGVNYECITLHYSRDFPFSMQGTKGKMTNTVNIYPNAGEIFTIAKNINPEQNFIEIVI